MQRLGSAVRVSASHSLGSGSKLSKIAASACSDIDERSLPWIWYFWFVNWRLFLFFAWFWNNSVCHVGCTAVMSNGVPCLPWYLRKWSNAGGIYTLVPRMGTLNGGPGIKIGGKFTPLSCYLPSLNSHRKEKAWNKPVCIHDHYTRYKDFTWATVRLSYPWVYKLN